MKSFHVLFNDDTNYGTVLVLAFMPFKSRYIKYRKLVRKKV